MVERFGKDESNWEHVELEIMSDEGDSSSKASLTNIVADPMVVEDDQMSISSYEIERQKRIDENRLALLQLVSSQHTLPHAPLLSISIKDDLTYFFRIGRG
jgi:hypothetical protein